MEKANYFLTYLLVRFTKDYTYILYLNNQMLPLLSPPVMHTCRATFNAKYLNFDFKAFLWILVFETLSPLICQATLFGNVFLNKVLLELVNACSLLYSA